MLNKSQRNIFGEKILDLVNIGAGALIFGQFLSEERFNWNLAILAISIFIAGFLSSYILLKNNQQDD